MTPRPPRGGLPGSVRIIGGHWRGTRLPVPDAPGLRPTSDRARETLFNWLQPALHGARVLDLFAGSGVLGLEALSRGAREALLVESEPRVAESLRASIERLRAGDRATLLRGDATAVLRAPLQGRFDIVFVDPPFSSGLWREVSQALPPWLAEEAWLYLESPGGQGIEPGPGWHLHRQQQTRDARHALYRRLPERAATLGPVSENSATP